MKTIDVLPPLDTSDALVLITCTVCGYEHYFDLGNLPGGLEHCEYCEVCTAPLPKSEVTA